MRLLVYICLILYGVTLMAQPKQNYVYNGSFEENVCCRDSTLPDSISGDIFETCVYSIISKYPSPIPPPTNIPMSRGYYTISKGWYGIGSTPDLFGACLGSPGAVFEDYNSVTQKRLMAQHGKGFFGMIVLDKYSLDSVFLDNGKEFLETKLKMQLSKNKQYCVSMYVSCGLQNKASVSDMSIFFSDTMFQRALYFDTNWVVVPLYAYCKPQLKNQKGAIDNRLSWRELNWLYTATGIENYITLGNFELDSNTTISPLPIDTLFDPGEDFIYNFIDNVSITELQDANAGKDTIICKGTSAQIGDEPIEGIEYSWQPSEGLSNPKIANPIATPSQTTTYRVTMHQCRDVIDEVTITVNPECKFAIPKPQAPSVLKRHEVLNIKNLPVTNNISIYNIAGQLVKQFTNYTNNEMLSNFAEGLYLLRISTDTESVVGKLLVVE